MHDPLEFFQVMSLILDNRPQSQVDGVFFHARTFNGDEDGLFELAGELIKTGISKNAVIINGGDGEGYTKGVKTWSGKDEYVKKLKSMGCNVFVASPGHNTLEETIAFHALSQKMNWKSAVVISQPFQLLRIMLTHLKVMEKFEQKLQIYAAAPRAVDWRKQTSCNQAKPDTPRFDQIKEEFDRLEPYFKQGNLASIDQLILYILRLKI